MTGKQKRFVQEYLIDLNATQAAIRAGYSEITAAEMGCLNLRKPNIAAAIAEAQASLADKAQFTAEDILRDLEEMRLLALAAGQFAPATRAAELRGKQIGMFVEKRETKITDERMVVSAPTPEESADDWAGKHRPH